MTIKSSGPLNLTEIQTEFGGENPISLNEYYGVASGIPTSGAISFNDFYGKTFLVSEVITTSRTGWTPRKNLARFIHIFVIGAGGSGGVSYPANRRVFLFGVQEGVGVSAGGGGGGIAYSRVAGDSLTSANIVIGTGGAGVSTSSEGGAVSGNAGTASSFVGSGLNMIGGGGNGGAASTRIDRQTTTDSVPTTPGGTASGGNVGNFTGGNGGSVRISKGDLGYAASGGGALAFEANDSTSKNSAAIDSTTNTASAGAKVSEYPGTYPSILNAYPASKSQSILVGSTITSFDGSDGRILTNTRTGSPAYGAGSGGSCHRGTPASGAGGDGMVIIVYEI
jgi:hypothetical protein